ncbi:hypothetical protein FRB91_005601 [Serendipita sp. 411]|nr:hypothetical protein FRC18_000920 [Serendipita sp. 400]KAG8853001.1 hypothetical protein FRB91_005601 [Serendipita sp. 411]
MSQYHNAPYMVPMVGGSPQPQQVYLSASPSGGNIMQLPPQNVQYIHAPPPGHAVPNQGGYIIQAGPIGQPMQQYFQNTPIVPVVGLPQVAYAQPQSQPQVHYALAASPNPTPLILWDIFQPTSSILGTNPSYPIHLNHSAVDPPVSSMRLICKDMPWMITIRKKDNSIVTIGDVFEAIYTQMQESIIHSEWRLMGPAVQKQVSNRFQQRLEQMAAVGQVEESRGIRRVDFLLGKTAFIGLKSDPKTLSKLVGDIDIQNAWLLVLGSR